MKSAQKGREAKRHIKEVRKAVKRYIKKGWHVIPIPYGKKVPHVKWSVLDIKKPDINRYFSKKSNVSILLGSKSGNLIDIDLDSPEAVRLAPYFLPETVKFGHDSNPNSHWLYYVDGEMKSKQFAGIKKNDELPGENHRGMLLEIRGEGHQTVFPPSIHVSGEAIAWSGKAEPTKMKVEDLTKAVGGLAAACLLATHWLPNTFRHHMALALSGGLLRAGWIEEDVLNFIETIAAAAGDEEIQDRLTAVRDTAIKIKNIKIVTGFPRLFSYIGDKRFIEWLAISKENIIDVYKHTDIGNAERLIDYHGRDLHYCHDLNAWLVWNDRFWEKDVDGAIHRIAIRVIREMGREALEIEDETHRGKLLLHATKSENGNKPEVMIRRAMNLGEIPIKSKSLDSDHFLLNCENGTLDLRTQELLPANREHYITKSIPVEYDEKAQCPKWKRYLRRIFGDDQELINYVRRAVGYSLTGDTREHCLFMLYGPKRSGKSTFINVISAMLGEFAQSARTETFLTRNPDRMSNDIARMTGARLISAVEVGKGKKFDEALIKTLTGGDRQTARFLYKEFFDFYATGKFWFAFNDKPKLSYDDKAVWTRVSLIPFFVTIPPKERIKTLKEQIISEELPGILAWAVRGCRSWQKKGLKKPKVVRDEIKSYKTEMDVVGRFVKECCSRGVNFKALLKNLHDAFQAWCVDNGEYSVPKKEFQAEIENKYKCQKYEGAHGYIYYKGISLNTSNR